MFLIVLLVLYIGKKCNFDILTYILSTIIPIIFLTISVYTGEKIKYLNWFNIKIYKIEEKIRNFFYSEYYINLEELEKLKRDLKESES